MSCGPGKASKQLTTPQAPWTLNCMQKDPAARPLNVLGRIQAGVNAKETGAQILAGQYGTGSD
jgi:hypothetical protein